MAPIPPQKSCAKAGLLAANSPSDKAKDIRADIG
jgi:hypothetical protein